NGTTVLLTTQYLDEADQLAERIAIIDHGKVIAEGTTGAIKASVGAGTLHVRLENEDDRPRAAQLLEAALGVPMQWEVDPFSLSARVSDGERTAEALAALTRSGIGYTNFALGQP